MSENPYGESYFTQESTKSAEDFTRYAALLKRLGVDPQRGRSCDIGCAEGAVFRSGLHAAEFYGFDISSHAIARCQQSFASVANHFAVADLNEGPPPFTGAFDLITAFDVIEHLDNLGYLKLFLSTGLAPSGHVLLTTPNAMSALRLLGRPYNGDMDETHVQLFTPYTLDFWLTRAGLERVALLTPFIFGSRIDGPTARLNVGGQIVALYRRPGCAPA